MLCRMKCYAQWQLLGGMSEDPALYPTPCWSQIEIECDSPDLGAWWTTTTMQLPFGGVRCYLDTIAGTGTKTWSAFNWHNTDWIIRIWNGPNAGGATFKGYLTAQNPAVQIALTAHDKWWASISAPAFAQVSVKVE